jgi:hypothetical protein
MLKEHTYTFPSSETYQRAACVRPSVSLYYGPQHHRPSHKNANTPQWCVRHIGSVSERIIQLHTVIGSNMLYRQSSMFYCSPCYTYEAHKPVYVGKYVSYLFAGGHAVASLVEALRYKPGSIPDSVTRIFYWRNHYGHINGPGVDWPPTHTSARNISRGVMVAGA